MVSKDVGQTFESVLGLLLIDTDNDEVDQNQAIILKLLVGVTADGSRVDVTDVIRIGPEAVLTITDDDRECTCIWVSRHSEACRHMNPVLTVLQ